MHNDRCVCVCVSVRVWPWNKTMEDHSFPLHRMQRFLVSLLITLLCLSKKDEKHGDLCMNKQAPPWICFTSSTLCVCVCVRASLRQMTPRLWCKVSGDHVCLDYTWNGLIQWAAFGGTQKRTTRWGAECKEVYLYFTRYTQVTVERNSGWRRRRGCSRWRWWVARHVEVSAGRGGWLQRRGEPGYRERKTTRRTLSKSSMKRLRQEPHTTPSWQNHLAAGSVKTRAFQQAPIANLLQVCVCVCASAARVRGNPTQPLSAPLQAQREAKTLICNATARQNSPGLIQLVCLREDIRMAELKTVSRSNEGFLERWSENNRIQQTTNIRTPRGSILRIVLTNGVKDETETCHHHQIPDQVAALDSQTIFRADFWGGLRCRMYISFLLFRFAQMQFYKMHCSIITCVYICMA